MVLDRVIENKYFPEIKNKTLTMDIKPTNKYGILNVGLVKNKYIITGYQWNYSYWDGERIRYIHSFDLRKLRERVLEIGQDWVILDNRKAIESYKFNNQLIEKHKKYVEKHGGNRKYYGSSGVSYVTIQKDNRQKNKKNYWRYSHNGINICDVKLDCLKEKVLNKGGEWIVRDVELYEHNLNKENLL